MEGDTPISFYTESELTPSGPVPQTGVEVTITNETPAAKDYPQALDLIKHRIIHWKKTKRLCCIIFEKIKLKSEDYIKKHKYFSKCIQLSEKTSHTHVLAILLKCVAYKYEWRQPLAYYFTKSDEEGPQMKAIIKTIVGAVVDTGFLPIALISNQDTAVQYAFRSLRRDTRRSLVLAGKRTDGTIHLNGQCLSVIYNPLHLGVRNHFLKKDIVLNGKTSSWQDVVLVYGFDRKVCGTPFCGVSKMRMLSLRKLIKRRLWIFAFQAENCQYLFSKRVAGIINFSNQFDFASRGTVKSPTLANTSELVVFLDDLYDSVTTTRRQAGEGDKQKKLRRKVTKHSEHHAFWIKAIETIKNIKFIDKNGKVTPSASTRTFQNWITTIKSFQRLLQLLKLHKNNIGCMYPGDFNLPLMEKWTSTLI